MRRREEPTKYTRLLTSELVWTVELPVLDLPRALVKESCWKTLCFNSIATLCHGPAEEGMFLETSKPP